MKVAVTVCIFVLGAVCSARPSHHGGRRQGGRIQVPVVVKVVCLVAMVRWS